MMAKSAFEVVSGPDFHEKADRWNLNFRFHLALVAGVGGNVWSSIEEACEQSAPVASSIKPDSQATATIQRQYEAYRALYPPLKPIFEKLS
jgi:sugar (pentulose or hexulose) kinase